MTHRALIANEKGNTSIVNRGFSAMQEVIAPQAIKLFHQILKCKSRTVIFYCKIRNILSGNNEKVTELNLYYEGF